MSTRPTETTPAMHDPGHDAQAQQILQLQSALQRAQATNQELALIADRVSDAIILSDASRCITWVNPAFTRLTGFTLTECHGQLSEELLCGPQTDAATITRINQQLAQGQSVDKLPVCHHRKDGTPLWVARSVHPVVGADGRVQRHIEVLTDLSDRRRADAEHDRRLEIEIALATRAEFLSHLSHGMRAPLNAILGFTQLLEMNAGPQADEGTRRHLGHLHAAGHQLLSLLDQALEYTQLEAAPVRPRTQRVELSMLIKDVCAALKTEAESRQITLVVDCQSPAVWADPQHTRSILTNLLRNAIQFSTPGSTVWLVGKASADAQEGVIEVRDQGSGIAAEDLPRLFQPFTRLASSVASVPGFSGHGLGLAISQRLAELMHGHISVSSTLGRGSVFALHLPMAASPGQSPGGARGQALRVTLPSLRVVYVEDNELNRSLVEALFAPYPQVRLYSAETAAEGALLIEREQPDVALIDIGLPDGSGLDLCRRLSQQPAHARVQWIALSGDALPEHIARALQTGFHHYLVKPLQIQRLLDILASRPA